MPEAANALKLKGNAAFAKHDWPTAIDFYTQAIEQYDREPSFFSNRAQVSALILVSAWFLETFRVFGANDGGLLQAHIKMEAYGYAIADATKALELDPANVKVYILLRLSYWPVYVRGLADGGYFYIGILAPSSRQHCHSEPPRGTQRLQIGHQTRTQQSDRQIKTDRM